jgi:hypothetical protein
MRRGPIRKIEHHFVNVTPTPPFRRIIAFDDRVLGCAKMFGRVSIWRLIAATDMPAGAANTKMQPAVTQLQAFFASQSARKHVADPCDMLAKYRAILQGHHAALSLTGNCVDSARATTRSRNARSALLCINSHSIATARFVAIAELTRPSP